MTQVARRPRAIEDLDEHAAFLGRTSPERAIRFLAAAEAAINSLAAMPGLGALWESNNPVLQGLRVWPIRKFKKYLIFYRQVEDTVEIVRVLIGSHNLPAILETES